MIVRRTGKELEVWEWGFGFDPNTSYAYVNIK